MQSHSRIALSWAVKSKKNSKKCQWHITLGFFVEKQRPYFKNQLKRILPLGGPFSISEIIIKRFKRNFIWNFQKCIWNWSLKTNEKKSTHAELYYLTLTCFLATKHGGILTKFIRKNIDC